MSSAEGGLSNIEQLRADQNCQAARRPMLLAINPHELTALFFKPRCKRWSCPYCGAVNQKLWTVRAYQGAERLLDTGEQVSFLTLTSHRQLGAAASVAVFGHAWHNLLDRARRTGPGQYLLIPERHQDGRLHAHAIETYSLGERWWKDNAAACGLGYMADEEPARSPGGAAWYVAKYIGKTLSAQTWPKGWRRVRTSQGFPKLTPLPQPEGWTITGVPAGDAIATRSQMLRNAGYIVGFAGSADAWLIIGDAGV